MDESFLGSNLKCTGIWIGCLMKPIYNTAPMKVITVMIKKSSKKFFFSFNTIQYQPDLEEYRVSSSPQIRLLLKKGETDRKRERERLKEKRQAMRPLFHSAVWRDLTKPGQVIDLWKKSRGNQWSHSPAQLYVVPILWGSNYPQSPYFLWAWGMGELICPDHTVPSMTPSWPSSSEIYMTLPKLIVPEGISIPWPLYHHMLVW